MKNRVSIEDFAPQAVILANGEYPTTAIPLSILMNSEMVVCCDGGANEYINQGHTPHAIIGDGDSIDPKYKEQFAHLIHTSSDQETNDQTKAVKFLIERGYKRIAIVGATGKREDHTIGNIALLIEYMREEVEIRSYTDYGVFIPCQDTQTFATEKGKQVSIFSFGAQHLQSDGLKYPIYDFTNWWQGTLNETIGDSFTISCEGRYMVMLNY